MCVKMQPFETPTNNPIETVDGVLVHPLREATLEEFEYERMKKLMSTRSNIEIEEGPCRVCGSIFNEDDVVLLDTDFTKECMYMVHTNCAYMKAKQRVNNDSITKQ
jgi:hypothetical protein